MTKLTCAKCGRESGETIAGFGQCPQCQRIWCSNCYPQGMGEAFGMAIMGNLCPECNKILVPPKVGGVTPEKSRTLPDEKSQRTLIIVVAVIAAVLIGGFFYFLLRKTVAPTPPPALPGAVRSGSPDWDKYSKLIARDDPEADEAKRALGDTVMTLHTTVRNFTGRTITGLEVRGSVVDHDGKPVKERTLVVIPGRQAELEPLKTMKVSIMIDGFTDSDDRANIKMEVTGFTLR